MNQTPKIRFVSDVDVHERRIDIRPPFRIDRENQRRFVRLEIQSPISVRRVKDDLGNFWPDENSYQFDGEILNISAGGVLVDLEQPLGENDVLSMRFSLQQQVTVQNVLGIVKRVERDDSHYLVGIEFISRNRLDDRLSDSELVLLTEQYGDFQQCVQEVLRNYLYTKSEE